MMIRWRGQNPSDFLGSKGRVPERQALRRSGRFFIVSGGSLTLFSLAGEKPGPMVRTSERAGQGAGKIATWRRMATGEEIMFQGVGNGSRQTGASAARAAGR